jgi:hypothetical protein
VSEAIRRLGSSWTLLAIAVLLCGEGEVQAG